jgi:hypothetical protein
VITLKRKEKPLIKDQESEAIVCASFNKYYKRSLLGLGSVKAIDYLYFHYSKEQIEYMRDLFKEVTTMENSHRAQLIYYLKYTKEDELHAINRAKLVKLLDKMATIQNRAELAELDTKIHELTKSIAAHDNHELESIQANQAKLEAEYKVMIEKVVDAKTQQERIDIYYQMKDIKDQMQGVKSQLKTYFKQIEISGYNRARFALAYLEYELKKQNIEGELINKFPSVGDAVMASYLTGDLDEQFTAKLLENARYQEGFVPMWKKIVDAGLYLLNQAAAFIPVAGQYISVGYLIYSTIKDMKISKEESVNEAHYF